MGAFSGSRIVLRKRGGLVYALLITEHCEFEWLCTCSRSDVQEEVKTTASYPC